MPRQTAAQQAEQAVEDYKSRVLGAVLEAQANHGLCDEGIREFLTSLDIKPPPTRQRAEVRIVIEFDADYEPTSYEVERDLDLSAKFIPFSDFSDASVEEIDVIDVEYVEA